MTNESEIMAEIPQRTYGEPEAEPGELLTLKPEQACAKAMKLFQSQTPFMRPLLEQWKLNEWLRRGITGGRLIQNPSNGQWQARPPTKSTVNAEFVNQAATICRKMPGILTADPPAPDAVPGEGDGDDPASAEFTTRALINVDGGLGRIKKITRAIDQSLTCSTTFERFFYNPTGDGRVPVEIEAGWDPVTGDQAQSVDDAEFQVIPGEPIINQLTQQPEVDPFTGEMVTTEPTQRPWPEMRPMLVREDGSLTDKKSEAATRWQGKIASEILRAPNVRMYPHTADDIDEAHGVGILSFVAWGKLRKNQAFAEKMAAIQMSQKDAIFNWHPDWTDAALPPGTDRRAMEAARAEGNEDEYLVPVLTTYFDGNMCPGDYPKGVYMVQIGESFELHRGPWEYEDGDGVSQPMMIPLSQCTLFREGRSHWAGVALMEIIGPGNEIRAAQIGSMLDYLDRLGSVKTLIPTTSIINPLEYADRSKRYITYNSDGGKPEVENLPPFPQAAAAMFDTMTQEINNASSLGDSGQGLEAANVKSGVQAMTVLSQVQAALAPQARAVIDFYLRGSRIELEMIRAHYTRSRQISWVGEDGRHKAQAWNRADLGTTTDVRLEAGTMTMMRPSQKALLAREYFQLGLIPPEEFQSATEKNIGGTLALQDNPYKQRIRRQIEDWKDGPPEGWVPPEQVMGPVPVVDPLTGMPSGDIQVDPNTGQPAMAPQIDPMTGQPMMQPDPVAMALWKPVPADVLPPVAQLRLNELSRLTATVKYERMPDPWKVQIEAEFQRMMTAAMPPAPMPMVDPEGGDDTALQPKTGKPSGPGAGQGAAPQIRPTPMATAM